MYPTLSHSLAPFDKFDLMSVPTGRNFFSLFYHLFLEGVVLFWSGKPTEGKKQLFLAHVLGVYTSVYGGVLQSCLLQQSVRLVGTNRPRRKGRATKKTVSPKLKVRFAKFLEWSPRWEHILYYFSLHALRPVKFSYLHNTFPGPLLFL